MQYGNFFLAYRFFHPTLEFKSYYVVWKLTSFKRYISFSPSLNRTMQYGNERYMHSSLNFGCCLNRTMQYGNCHLTMLIALHFMSFKSYYVVWKPLTISHTKNTDYSLNRTMQYGNYHLTILIAPHFIRLNRTMQYGNYYCPTEMYMWSSRLNRTMQYGNPFPSC